MPLCVWVGVEEERDGRGGELRYYAKVARHLDREQSPLETQGSNN